MADEVEGGRVAFIEVPDSWVPFLERLLDRPNRHVFVDLTTEEISTISARNITRRGEPRTSNLPACHDAAFVSITPTIVDAINRLQPLRMGLGSLVNEFMILITDHEHGGRERIPDMSKEDILTIAGKWLSLDEAAHDMLSTVAAIREQAVEFLARPYVHKVLADRGQLLIEAPHCPGSLYRRDKARRLRGHFRQFAQLGRFMMLLETQAEEVVRWTKMLYSHQSATFAAHMFTDPTLFPRGSRMAAFVENRQHWNSGEDNLFISIVKQLLASDDDSNSDDGETETPESPSST